MPAIPWIVRLETSGTVERIVRLAHAGLPDWPAETRRFYQRELRRTHLLGSTRDPAKALASSAEARCVANSIEHAAEPRGEPVGADNGTQDDSARAQQDEESQDPESEVVAVGSAPEPADDVSCESGGGLPKRGVFLDQILGRWPAEDAIRVLDMVGLARYEGWLHGRALTDEQLQDIRETVEDPPAPIDEPGEWWA